MVSGGGGRLDGGIVPPRKKVSKRTPYAMCHQKVFGVKRAPHPTLRATFPSGDLRARFLRKPHHIGY